MEKGFFFFIYKNMAFQFNKKTNRLKIEQKNGIKYEYGIKFH